MEYKSKHTASEIDAKLSQVFDSTLQTKEVEVSEDTTIKADEGFLGLKEVSVKVSGGGNSASYFKYYLIDNALGGTTYLFSSIIKVQSGGNTFIAPTATAVLELGDEIYNKDIVKAFGVDLNQKLYVDGVWITIEEVVGPGSYYTEITEEQFYTL